MVPQTPSQKSGDTSSSPGSTETSMKFLPVRTRSTSTTGSKTCYFWSLGPRPSTGRTTPRREVSGCSVSLVPRTLGPSTCLRPALSHRIGDVPVNFDSLKVKNLERVSDFWSPDLSSPTRSHPQKTVKFPRCSESVATRDWFGPWKWRTEGRRVWRR